MKIKILFFSFLIFSTCTAIAQCESISVLKFPYEKGLIMSLKGERIVYDNLNFPSKTMDYMIHYSVSDNKVTGSANQSNFVINIISDKDTIVRNDQCPLTIDSKGMSWKGNGQKKVTNDIKLPLEKGKEWVADYNNMKLELVCFTIDTTISLYLGNVKAFGISYKKITGKDDRFDYYDEYKDWYNIHLGKIATDFKHYGIERQSQRQYMINRKYTQLNYTNISQAKIEEALKYCN